jgi:hypothetical protein
VAIGYVTVRQHWNSAKRLDYAIYYLVFAGFFIPLWAVWNKVIVQSGWLGFTNSEYAASSNWVTDSEPSTGHPWIAIKTYWYAMSEIGGLPLILLSIAGLICFLLRDRLKARTSGALVLLFPAPFFSLMLWSGQRPLHVPQIDGEMYNIRFALQMMPFMALMTAVLFDEVIYFLRDPWFRVLAASIAIGVAVLITPLHTITLEEPVAASHSDSVRADQISVGAWIEEHYPGDGRVLMETPGNEAALFYSELPLDQVVYEGVNKNNLWLNALQDPALYVDWVFMRITPDQPDKVATAMAENPHALDDFHLIYSTSSVQIYARNS